jgi:hypothetical protein
MLYEGWIFARGRLTKQLDEQFAESAWLEQEMQKNLQGFGYDR